MRFAFLPLLPRGKGLCIALYISDLLLLLLLDTLAPPMKDSIFKSPWPARCVTCVAC